MQDPYGCVVGEVKNKHLFDKAQLDVTQESGINGKAVPISTISLLFFVITSIQGIYNYIPETNHFLWY